MMESLGKLPGGKLRENVVTVVIDKSNGKMFYGISGPKSLTADPLSNPTRRVEYHKDLQSLLEGHITHYNYSLENCGEFNAINNAFNDGSSKNSLNIYSIYKLRKLC